MVRKNRSAFTLIELLVVISIIALLISILLPSGVSHYSSNPIVIMRKADAASLPLYRLGNMLNESEVLLVGDGVQVGGHFNWSAEPVAFMGDEGVVFGTPWMAGGISASQRERVIMRGLNYDPEGFVYGPGGDFRWRHSQQEAVNVIFADGHATSSVEGELRRGNLFPKTWKAQTAP